MEKECYFEKDDVGDINYKNVDILKKFITPHGQIYGRRYTGVCAKHQRKLTRAVKHARYMGLLPYIST